MITFIDEHRGIYGVEPICRVLPIAPSTYHAHAARRADPGRQSPRSKRDEILKAHIRRVFEENFRVYGVRLRQVFTSEDPRALISISPKVSDAAV